MNATYIQPFFTYTWKTATTVGVNMESTYDWANRQRTVPLNLTASEALKFGNQPISFTLGWRYYPEAPKDGPEGGSDST